MVVRGNSLMERSRLEHEISDYITLRTALPVHDSNGHRDSTPCRLVDSAPSYSQDPQNRGPTPPRRTGGNDQGQQARVIRNKYKFTTPDGLSPAEARPRVQRDMPGHTRPQGLLWESVMRTFLVQKRWGYYCLVTLTSTLNQTLN